MTEQLTIDNVQLTVGMQFSANDYPGWIELVHLNVPERTAVLRFREEDYTTDRTVTASSIVAGLEFGILIRRIVLPKGEEQSFFDAVFSEKP